MTLTLPAELQGFVEGKVKTGAFSSDDEVICAAVTLMKDHDGEYERQVQWLRDAVDKGWQSAREGKLYSPEEVRAGLEEHKRQWRAARAGA
jgi:putative addiction module CopG family antidote